MKFLNKIFNQSIKEDHKIIATNYFSLSILQIANYILPLLTLPYLVRVLGAEKFGLIMFAQALATILTVLVDFGFNLSGTREVSVARNEREKLSEIFSAIMIIKIFLIFLAFLILFIIVNVFPRFSADADVYILSFGIVIGQALFPVWFFQGIEKMKVVTLINILAKVIFTVLVFVLVKVESDYILVPFFNSLGFIVAGILGLFLSLKYVRVKSPSFDLIKQLLFESSSLFVSNFATMLYTYGNVFILGIFTGNTVVGVYSSMEKLILAIKNIFTPLYQALYPWLTKQTDKKKIKVINRLSPIVLLIGVIITLTIVLFGKSILSIIYNDALITSNASLFKILSVISIFSALSMLYNTLFFPSVKKYKTRMLILVSAGLFNLILSLILVPQFGIFGTTYTFVSTEFLLLILGWFYFKKYIREWKG